MLSDVIVRRFKHAGLTLDCWYRKQFSGMAPPQHVASHPVIIFEHGYQGNARQNSHQMRFLAGQGYILLAVNHPGESLFATGRRSAESGQSRALNTLNIARIPLERKETRKTYERFRQSRNRHELLEAMKNFSGLKCFASVHEAISSRMERVSILLASMRELNRRKEMGGRMDLGNVGIYGYSMGGNVGCLLATKHNLPIQFKAVANLDGVRLVRAGEPLPQMSIPLMMVYGTGILLGNLTMNLEGANDWLFGTRGGWRVVFRGARHANFSNLGRLGFLRGSVNGRLNGDRMTRALNTLLLNWFDWHLKGRVADMDELRRLYPLWDISCYPVL